MSDEVRDPLDRLLAVSRSELDHLEHRGGFAPARFEAVTAAISSSAQTCHQRRRRAIRLAWFAAVAVALAPVAYGLLSMWILDGFSRFPEFSVGERWQLVRALLFLEACALLVAALPVVGTRVATRHDGVRYVFGRSLQWVAGAIVLLAVTTTAFGLALDSGLGQETLIATLITMESIGAVGAATFMAMFWSGPGEIDQGDGLEREIPFASLFRASMVLAAGDALVLVFAGLTVLIYAGASVPSFATTAGSLALITAPVFVIAGLLVVCIRGLHALKTWALIATVSLNFLVFALGFTRVLPLGGFMVFLGATTAVQMVLPVPLIAAMVRGRVVDRPRMHGWGREIAARFPVILAIYCVAAVPIGCLVGLWLNRFP